MKSVKHYILEAQNFLIKGHTKNQNTGFKLYAYIDSDCKGADGMGFVALTTKREIEEFNNSNLADKTYNIDQLNNNNEWVAVWPDDNDKLESVNMEYKYFTDKYYRFVTIVPSLKDITEKFYVKHNVRLPK